MIAALILYSQVQEYRTDSFFYIDGRCEIYYNSNINIYWGLEKSECDPIVKSDRILNIAYVAAMKKLKPEQKLALRNDQRQWIISRNKTCKFDKYVTILFSDQAECFIKNTNYRTNYLITYK